MSNHNEFMNTLRRLIEPLLEHNWIPRPWYSEGSNPVKIMLKKTGSCPQALRVVRLLIDYCTERAKATGDISYLLLCLECLDDLVSQYPDIGLAITKTFAYFKWIDRDLVVNNHTIIYPPSFSLGYLWTPKVRKIHECKNPVIQMNYTDEDHDPLNANFTDDIFVTPVNLLWSFSPNPQSSISELPTTRSLIYVAFVKADESWRQVWLENRLWVERENTRGSDSVNPNDTQENTTELKRDVVKV
ncbi:hypothetical protein BGW38_003120 [Lunasporangiospora selenospora]|uniref:Uncharacterized protein n=1 Tax=Lunasporangiospora selenospora TaxID=979761 RepID=A0A9P6G1G4_9FUNG|nr:hypothetical protein BGW38_003120 [Lunasporangiospora selenospora]